MAIENLEVPGEDLLYPRASLVAQRLKHLPAVWETWVRSLVRKIPWRRKWQPTPVFLSGKSHGQRSLVGYTPQDSKESDMTSLCSFLLPDSISLYLSSAYVIVLVPWAVWCPQVHQSCREFDLLFCPLEIGSLGNWLTSLVAFLQNYL